MKNESNYFFSIENNAYNERTKETERYVAGYFRTFEEARQQIETRAKLYDLDFEIYGLDTPTYNEILKPSHEIYAVRWFRDGNLVQPHIEGIYMARFINAHKFD